jgi:hypothetical protein
MNEKICCIISPGAKVWQAMQQEAPEDPITSSRSQPDPKISLKASNGALRC